MKVSIITPSYNQGKFIEATILSVLNQEYKDIEYIVIDGGSTDNSMEIINKYADRINKVICEKDNGQADAINKGFKMATGTLVGWLNSDDVLYKDCVKNIVDLATTNPDGVIYYPSKMDFIDGSGHKCRQVENKISNKEHLLNINYDIMQQGSFYRLNAVKEAGMLDEAINYCMDLDLWLKLLNKGKIYYYDQKPLAAFRLWDGSKTVSSEIDFLNNIQQVLRSNGMKRYSANSKKLYISKFKKRVKYFIKKSAVSTQG